MSISSHPAASAVYDKCPVCGASGGKLETRLKPRSPRAQEPAQRPHSYDISETARANASMSVLFCPACGLGWSVSDPAAADQYDYPEQPAYIFEEKNRIRTASRLLSGLPRGAGTGAGRLLDVGCSVGYLVKAASEMGFDATGVEPSAWAAAYAEKNLGIKIVNSYFKKGLFPAGAFDIITMTDFIEHSRNFDDHLEAAAGCLAPGGLLVMSTPDIGSLAARFLGRRWWSLKPDHVVYFSRGSLLAAAARHGFKPESCSTHGRYFSAAYWLHLLTGTFGLKKNSLTARVRFYMDFKDQLLCVFRKQDKI